MSFRPGILGVAAVLALAMVLAGGLLWQGPRSLVDWTGVRAVAIESDDWGLAGFISDSGALEGLDRQALHPGAFPPVYWGSTLEDSAMVGGLTRILGSVSGRDGLPAVLQPNYVLGSLEYHTGAGARPWLERHWPATPAAYRRPGLAQAVDAAITRGVWYPEYHALYHYDPEARRRAVAGNQTAAVAASRGVLIFPGSQQAWELGPGRDDAVRAAELDKGLRVFRDAFGRTPGSVIAPDYTWDARAEELWLTRGLRVIQAKREQRLPARGWGPGPRVAKLLQQRWEKLTHRDRVYLERNARFEPVQAAAPARVPGTCMQEIRRAWRQGTPAIIEAHRVNFAHTDPAVVQAGQAAFAALLEQLSAEDPAPVFLTDMEIARLLRVGVSACRRGDLLVVRNLSHTARVVSLDGVGLLNRVCWLPAGAIRILEFNPGH